MVWGPRLLKCTYLSYDIEMKSADYFENQKQGCTIPKPLRTRRKGWKMPETKRCMSMFLPKKLFNTFYKVFLQACVEVFPFKVLTLKRSNKPYNIWLHNNARFFAVCVLILKTDGVPFVKCYLRENDTRLHLLVGP